MPSARILHGDCINMLKTLPDQTVNTCITSPPYFGLRDYGVDGQIGLEATPAAYVEKLVAVFREVRRVLRDDGTLWLNLGDSYAGSWGARGRGDGTNAARPDLESKHGTAAPNRHGFPALGIKPKDLIGIPWMLAFALRADGWFLRQDIIWHKPNPMPESVRDRCTKAHEYIFLMSKSERYYYDVDAVREPYETADREGPRRSYKPGSASSHRIDGGHEEMSGSFAGLPLNQLGRNKRSVWTVSPSAYKGAHFAVFPPALIEPCVRAGAPLGGLVLDPFTGSGTTAEVALRHDRNFIGCELNPAYISLAQQRIDAALYGDLA